MSTINLHPPQTYSRLFRPWDTNRDASASTTAATATRCGGQEQRQLTPALANNAASIVKREYDETTTIKTELHNFNGNSDSERECASSSSCKSSYEDGLNSSFNRTSTPIMDVLSQHAPSSGSSGSSSSAALSPIYLAAQQQPTANTATVTQSPQLTFMPPASELYYAAAAAAAASGLNGTAAAFGMDPYTLGLMEQEYARVMAEDAHLKAINARKQRPKKFKCPHCDVAFSNNGQLKGHIRIHTGERPFKCDVEICGKTFTRNEELTRHKRIHTGLRPYPCTACGKKFGRRDHLKKHMKTHMPQERQLGPAIFVPMYPYMYGY